MTRLRRAWLEASVLAATALSGGLARADGLSATAEPVYSHVETDVIDQAGKSTHESTDELAQKYRLGLDVSLTERLVAAAGATLLEDEAWRRTDGVWSYAHGRTASLFGRLTLGTPSLSAGLGADRNEQRVLSVSSTPTVVTESYTGYASWRPLDLPDLEVHAGHVNSYDLGRHTRDTTTDSASFGARYRGPAYDVRYLLSWNRAEDHLHDTRTTGIDQTLLGSRTDSLFGGRTSTYVSATVQSREVFNVTRGQGGTVPRQQLPIAGLSAVEAFPATAENVVLSPNPSLIDGNLTASASVNVGFGPSVLGDRDFRSVGARFADVVTPVNTIYVWLDKKPSAEVGNALVADVQVYQSDDNQTWSAVAIASVPVVSPFESRIEIAIAQTQARYLKVRLRPIPAGVTTDTTFRDLFVTEVQFLLVLPASLVPHRQSALTTSATAFARTVILRRQPEFAHDISASITRDSEAERTRYTVVNGLSLAHKLTAGLAANARGARQDQDSGRGHEGMWQWSAALVGQPLPTAYWTTIYSGSLRDGEPTLDPFGRTTRTEPTLTHSVSALGRADWYEGISSQANAGASISTQGLRTTRTAQASGTSTFTPNRVLTLTAGVQYNRSLASSPDTGDVLTEFGRVDGSIALTPAPALSATGTLARVFLGIRPTTLATVQLNYFPLRGDLQLAATYSRTLDTEAEATTEILTPSLRWNLRRGLSLTSSYTYLRNEAPVQTLTSRAFVASLLLSL